MSRYGRRHGRARPILPAARPIEADARRRAERLFDAAAQSGLDLRAWTTPRTRSPRSACQRAPVPGHPPDPRPSPTGSGRGGPVFAPREAPRRADRRGRSRAAAAANRPSCAPRCGACAATSWSGSARASSSSASTPRSAASWRASPTPASTRRSRSTTPSCARATARRATPTTTASSATPRSRVIGMGKLGGEELNFSSDVDVIYVYSSDARRGRRAVAARVLREAVHAVTRALSRGHRGRPGVPRRSAAAPRGRARARSPTRWRRPSATTRPSAGRGSARRGSRRGRPPATAALGAEMLPTLRPFVFPRYTVADVDRRRPRAQPPDQARARARRGDGFDVKNGEGGIREIEFFVQALQLIHGGKHPRLRARGTLAALDALLFAGLVTDDEHLALCARLPLAAPRRARAAARRRRCRRRRSPTTDARARFARRLGYADAASARADLVAPHRARSRGCSRRSATPRATTSGPTSRRSCAASSDEPRRPTRSRASAFTTSPPRAPSSRARAAARLAARRRPPTERAARVGAALLGEIAASRRSRSGAAHARRSDRAARRRRGRSGACSTSNPALAAPARLALRRERVPRAHPRRHARADRPARRARPVAAARTVAADRARDLDARLAHGRSPTTPRRCGARSPRSRTATCCASALADFAGALDALGGVRRADRDRRGLPRARARASSRPARTRHGRAAGALGGARARQARRPRARLRRRPRRRVRLRPATTTSRDRARSRRLAQRLLGALRQRTPRGRLYEVDTRLRPSGSQGPLVSSLAAWRRYHEQDARLWERQALIKLRPVAGDPALGAGGRAARRDRLRHASRWRAPTAILSMRDRDRARARREPSDLKVGAGRPHGRRVRRSVPAARPRPRACRACARPAPRPRCAPRHAWVSRRSRHVELLDQGYRFLRGSSTGCASCTISRSTRCRRRATSSTSSRAARDSPTAARCSSTSSGGSTTSERPTSAARCVAHSQPHRVTR